MVILLNQRLLWEPLFKKLLNFVLLFIVIHVYKTLRTKRLKHLPRVTFLVYFWYIWMLNHTWFLLNYTIFWIYWIFTLNCTITICIRNIFFLRRPLLAFHITFWEIFLKHNVNIPMLFILAFASRLLTKHKVVRHII